MFTHHIVLGLVIYLFGERICPPRFAGLGLLPLSGKWVNPGGVVPRALLEPAASAGPALPSTVTSTTSRRPWTLSRKVRVISWPATTSSRVIILPALLIL